MEMVQGMLDKNYITRLPIKVLVANDWLSGISVGSASQEVRSNVTENLANYGVINWIYIEKEQLRVNNGEFFDV